MSAHKLKIDLKKPLKDLNGDPIISSQEGRQITFGEALASMVLMDQTNAFSKLKQYTLSISLTSDKDIEVDSADFDCIKKVIEKSKVYQSAIIPGQMLLELTKLKPESEEEVKKTV